MISFLEKLTVMMQIEEKIPVEVCRTTRTNDAGIKINRGQPVLREGEKRRTKISKSNGNSTIITNKILVIRN